MSILSQILRAVGGAAARLGESLIPAIPIWAQFTRIGGSVSPDVISGIIREADAGKPARLVDLLHELRQKDGHLQAVLGVRELALAGLEWSVDPPENATEREIECAAQCEAAIRACESFPVVLAHLAGEGCLFPTGAWAELVWEVSPFGDLAGLEVPRHMKPISSRRFGFRRSDGHLVFVEYGRDPDTSGIYLLDEYGVGNFISYRPRINGDVPVREGLGRCLVWMSGLRNWGVRDWLELGELGWKPRTIISYDKDADEKDTSLAQTIAEVLTGRSSVVHPKTLDVAVVWPKSSGSNLQSVHREICEFFGQEESKAVLGQTLTTEAGSRGARALGVVHDNIRLDIRESDAVGVGASINEFIVRPFYGFNYGSTVRRGTFRFHTEEGVDMAKIADVIKKVAPYVAIPQAWVRDQLGIPEPSENEPICELRGGDDDDTDPSGGDDTSDEDSDDDELDDAA